MQCVAFRVLLFSAPPAAYILSNFYPRLSVA